MTWCRINGVLKDVRECKLNHELCECGTQQYRQRRDAPTRAAAPAAQPAASGVDAQWVESLLWDEQPECCGSPVVGAEYMGQQELVCCGCPEGALLNDAQIVATLRAKFPKRASQKKGATK